MSTGLPRKFSAGLVCATVVLASLPAQAGKWRGRLAEDRLIGSPWPAKVEGHVPIKPGEHPRLLFRKSDLPELRRRAQTPAGKMIIKRLRYLLNGSDGETMTTVFNPAKTNYQMIGGQRGGRLHHNKPGVWTISHAAGYGFLFQLTGDKKYAEFGKQCMLKAIDDEQRDRDSVYAIWESEALRFGPAMAWTALGYDLCYDGWDEETRRDIANRLLHHDGENGYSNMVDIAARGRAKFAACNHWGGVISGTTMLALATMGDPEADQAQVQRLLDWGKVTTMNQLLEGIGDYGFFGGGQGAAGLTKDSAFIPLLQAWRVAAGLDYVQPREFGNWMVLDYVQGSIPAKEGGKPHFTLRGAYPHNFFARKGITGSGYFAQGFGILDDKYKPALLWLYNRTYRDSDFAAEMPYGSINNYPHRSIMALVNWPFDMEEGNPGDVLPTITIDRYWNMVNIREKWSGPNDWIISVLTEDAGGHYVSSADVMIQFGEESSTPPIALRGKILGVKKLKKGYSIKTDKGSLGIDISRRAGSCKFLLVWKNGQDVVSAEQLEELQSAGKRVVYAKGIQAIFKPNASIGEMKPVEDAGDLMDLDGIGLDEPDVVKKRQKEEAAKPLQAAFHVMGVGGTAPKASYIDENTVRIGKITATIEDGYVVFK